jgi:hypothetical protein
MQSALLYARVETLHQRLYAAARIIYLTHLAAVVLQLSFREPVLMQEGFGAGHAAFRPSSA